MSLEVFFIELEFPDLFREVMVRRLFADSKTFADAIPRNIPSLINRRFSQIDTSNDKAILDFVHEWFIIPETPQTNINEKRSLEEHIHSLWPLLTRQDSIKEDLSTRIPLPKEYVVPGGRFREIYYWDSYFTMLGLRESGRLDGIRDMIGNFAWLIDQIGFIPNGNRSYFLSRSQPPFFSLMIELLAKIDGRAVYTKYLPQLLNEYWFWTNGMNERENAHKRIVRIKDHFLNRYFDDNPSPRVESYAEDVLLQKESGKPEDLFLNLRAACESGWDFSSRWLVNSKDLSSIRTTQILPVDLNVLIYILEKTIAATYYEMRDHALADKFNKLAQTRAGLINTIFWNNDEGYYTDYWINKQSFGIPSLAMSFPLFASIASREQAQRTANYLENHLLKPGGWVTTNKHTGQQWDAPNGWAPLQWITYTGLQNYGYDSLAQEGAKRWLKLNEDVFERTGRMMEKYNVEDLSLEAGGGEYPVQDGFGWTNGVYLALKKELSPL